MSRIMFIGLAAFGLLALDFASASPAAAQTLSALCRFHSGQNQGQVVDYAPRPPVPVGSPCYDGQGGQGVVVASRNDSALCSASTLCAFTFGPMTGATRDYAPMAAVPVGMQCHDGAGSTGVVIPPAACGDAKYSTLCEFSSGPRQGQIQDYSPMAPLPVNTPCQDGYGSSGKVVASGSPSGATSSTCHYHTGPAAGRVQFFPNVTPVEIGTPCWDGVSSLGISVPDVPSNSFSSTWNGDTAIKPPVAPIPPSAPTATVPQEPRPIDVSRQCVAGGQIVNVPAIAECMGKNLPPNLMQQCASNPSACFLPTDPLWGNLQVLKKGAEFVGIDLQKPAQFLDKKVWGPLKKLF